MHPTKESSGESTPQPQTRRIPPVTPGAPIKIRDGRRVKAMTEVAENAVREVIEKRRADKGRADEKVTELVEKKKLAENEEAMAKQEYLVAEQDLNSSRKESLKANDEYRKANSSDSRMKAENAAYGLHKAEEKYETATTRFQVASQNVTEAEEALQDAMSDASSIAQLLSRMTWEDQSLKDTSNLDEDDLIQKYSRFMSYSKHKYPNYPIRVWTMSANQLECFKHQYIIPEVLTRVEAISRINKILAENAENIKKHQDFWFDIPKRKREFQDYCPSLAMPLLRQGYVIRRSFKNGRTRRTAAITAWLLNLLYEYTSQGKTVTLREIFYEGKYMFNSPDEAASILADICAMIGCTSSSLSVIPRQKGTVIGNFRIKLKNVDVEKAINCSGRSTFIPYDVRNIERVLVDESVHYVLVVEKGTMYDRLVQSKFYETNNCIIVCGYGQPDERTRRFLRIIEEQTQLLIFGLTDPDPYGTSIVKTYAKGSDHLAHSNISLAVVSLHWIGISTLEIQDIEDRNRGIQILKRCPKLNQRERKMLQNLKSSKYELSGLWVKRINHMLYLDKKSCFEDLIILGRDYVTEQLLPRLISDVKKDIEVHSLSTSSVISLPVPPRHFEFDELDSVTTGFMDGFLVHGNTDIYRVRGQMILKKVPASSFSLADLLEHLTRSCNLQNKNFLQVLGYSVVPNDDQYIVYEDAQMGSLHDILHVNKQPLMWNDRLKVAIGAANGLKFLHEDRQTKPVIVHGSIRSKKILLFDNFEAKIGDFSFSPHDPSHYDAPDYVINSPTEKDDVYSFGVVLLELLSGKIPGQIIENKTFVNWAIPKLNEGRRKVLECIDPDLERRNSSTYVAFAGIVSKCLLNDPHQRPSMDIVCRLLGKLQGAQQRPAA